MGSYQYTTLSVWECWRERGRSFLWFPVGALSMRLGWCAAGVLHCFEFSLAIQKVLHWGAGILSLWMGGMCVCHIQCARFQSHVAENGGKNVRRGFPRINGGGWGWGGGGLFSDAPLYYSKTCFWSNQSEILMKFRLFSNQKIIFQHAIFPSNFWNFLAKVKTSFHDPFCRLPSKFQFSNKVQHQWCHFFIFQQISIKMLSFFCFLT